MEAWDFVDRNVAELKQSGVQFIVDVDHTKFGQFPDERQLGKVTIDRDFAVDHQSFIRAAIRDLSRNSGRKIEVLRVSGKFAEDEQAEQRTPAFWVTWECQLAGTNNKIKVQGFAFGPRYNNLSGSAQRRRQEMLDSAAIAYAAATYVVLSKLAIAVRH